MHSRIFQVSMEPIEEENYICEAEYCDHWFTREIANYVSDDCDRDGDIKRLANIAKGYSVGEDDNGELILAQPFHGFPVGEFTQDDWFHWVDDHHSKGVGWVYENISPFD